MSVRVFVPSAAFIIFAWLAATYLRTVPMDTYPTTAPAQALVPSSAPASAPQSESTIMVSTKDPLTVSVPAATKR